MENQTPDPKLIAKEEFKVEHYIALWQHYRNSGGSDKNRMVTVVTWLLAFAAGILAYTATKFDFSEWLFKDKEKGLATVGSIIGFCICSLSTYLVSSFAGYADRNFQRADKIKEKIAYLFQDTKNLLEGCKGIIFKNLGVLFDVFLYFSVLVGLLFLAIIVVIIKR